MRHRGKQTQVQANGHRYRQEMASLHAYAYKVVQAQEHKYREKTRTEIDLRETGLPESTDSKGTRT
eukprot:35260-Pelagomonas_calceolata.AAC.1